MEHNYVDNKRHGICIDYYKNGNKEFEYNYANGKKMVCVVIIMII